MKCHLTPYPDPPNVGWYFGVEVKTQYNGPIILQLVGEGVVLDYDFIWGD